MGTVPLARNRPRLPFDAYHQAACRSGGANDGSIEITMEEMQLLLADPEFWAYEAKFAEMIQKYLPPADASGE